MKNHLKKSLGLVASMLLLAGCVDAPPVTTYVDPLTNQPTDLLSENELPGPEQPREVIWLNASRLPVGRDKYQTYLEVVYGTRPEAGPLDIYPGRTLTIIADGQEMKFSGLGSSNTRKERDGVLFETALYEAQPSDIKTIASAKKVTILLQGKDLLIERNFGPENFEKFKQFADKLSVTPPKATPGMAKGYFR